MARYTDKARLDFLLFKNPMRIHYISDGLLKRYYDGYFETPRLAIDAAIRESEKAEAGVGDELPTL